MLIGFIFAFSSWIRYFVLYPDLDKAIVYALVGILIIIISIIYDKFLKLENNILYMEDFISSFQETKQTLPEKAEPFSVTGHF